MPTVPETEAKLIEKQYKEGLAYLKQMGFFTKWPENERFKAGDQWPQATAKTKNMPRPVFNIVRFIINHKTASVMNENIKMLFTPEEAPSEQQIGDPMLLETSSEAADKFTKFAETTWENIKQDELNEDALEDCATTGTCYWHYYWDNSKEGGLSLKFKGDLVGETLDPINVLVGNPQQRDLQKQPHIIISSREMTASVKELAKSNGLPAHLVELITPDKDSNDEGYDSAKVELTGSEKTTVLTKYWRKGGFIYFKKVASGQVVQPETNTGMRLYPIASMQWEKRKKSAYGMSEAEGIIPAQKAINFLIAMLILSVQETAWPKMLVKTGALRQAITNVPGEIITDYSDEGGDGIKYMQTGQVNQFASVLSDKIIELVRTFTGASEVSTGDPFTKQLNASAIIALQNQAKIPIEMIRKRYYRAMEDIGRIWEEFYKVKYNMDRVVNFKDNDANEYSDVFNGSMYADIPLRLKIDIGASSNYTESLMMASLDKFLDSQYITFDQYLKYVPKNVVPYKDRLLTEIEQRQQEMAAQQAMMPQQPSMDMIMQGLTPDEQAFVQENPEVLNEIA